MVVRHPDRVIVHLAVVVLGGEGVPGTQGCARRWNFPKPQIMRDDPRRVRRAGGDPESRNIAAAFQRIQPEPAPARKPDRDRIRRAIGIKCYYWRIRNEMDRIADLALRTRSMRTGSGRNGSERAKNNQTGTGENRLSMEHNVLRVLGHTGHCSRKTERPAESCPVVSSR